MELNEEKIDANIDNSSKINLEILQLRYQIPTIFYLYIPIFLNLKIKISIYKAI